MKVYWRRLVYTQCQIKSCLWPGTTHYTTIYFSCDQTTKWTPKVFISLIISYKQEMRIVTFTEKPISNLFLRRQSKRYRCTSSIAIYAWRVTLIFNKFSDAWWRCTSCHDDYLRRHSSGICGIWTVCNQLYRKGNIIFNNGLFTVHNKNITSAKNKEEKLYFFNGFNFFCREMKKKTGKMRYILIFKSLIYLLPNGVNLFQALTRSLTGFNVWSIKWTLT